jgi:hypothetical protein
MKHPRAFTLRHATSTAAALALSVSALALAAAPAQAAINDQAVSGVASPMGQTNGPVDALAVANGVIYAGGNFTRVRPSGAASGTNQTTRNYLAAFNASTGALITTFNPNPNGRINALEVSPNGQTLYVGGNFTSIGGSTRNRIAAITLSTGAVSSFNPNANRPVRSIDSTASTVYIGGDFTTVGGKSQANMASVTAATGALNTAFAPTFIKRPDLVCPPPQSPFCTPTTYTPNVLAIQVSPDGSRVLTGGNFMGVNGVTSGGMASLNPTTGATEPWAANTAQPINTNCAGRVSSIAVQGNQAFVTGVGDPPGCYEGTYSANISDGSLNWLSSCLGASQGITIMNNILYKGSHQHDCAFNPGGAMGGFVGGTGRSGFIHHHLVGQNIANGTFVHWSPNTNGSGSAATGPHTITNDGNQIIVGGDFTTVNGANQQGLARFVANGNHATPSVPGRSINADPFGGQPSTGVAANLKITVQPTAAGTLTVLIPTSDDADSGTLTYRVYRDGGSTPVATLSAESYTWSRPVLRFDDKGLAAGSTHSYRVSANDGTFTSAQSTAVSGTVRSSGPSSFASTMSGLNPLLWWRLDDSGSTAADSSSTGSHPGSFQGGVTTGVAGALTGDNAVTLNGTTGYITSSNQIAAPNAFSESVWFKTTTTSGGSLLAQSSVQTGSGGNTDRTITMDNNGDLVFAVKQPGAGSPFGPATTNFRNQDTIWNDGKWHQVVGTYDGNGTIFLYVDGQLEGSTTGTDFNGNPVSAAGMPTSYLRAGYADLSGMQMVFGINFYNRAWPISEHFSGSLDEPAAFNVALSAAQVQSMYAAGVGGGA